MKASFLLSFALALAFAGCNRAYHPGSVDITAGGDGFSMTGLHRGGKLVYAFAWPRDVPLMNTNDASQAPRVPGIHFLYTSPDGLWFNGRKVVRSADTKVIVLRRDGTPVPLVLSAAELQEVAALTKPSNALRVVSPELKAKVVAAFKGELEKPGS